MTPGGRPPAGKTQRYTSRKKTHESAHSQHGHRSQNWANICCIELAEPHSDVSVTRQAFRNRASNLQTFDSVWWLGRCQNYQICCNLLQSVEPDLHYIYRLQSLDDRPWL